MKLQRSTHMAVVTLLTTLFLYSCAGSNSKGDGSNTNSAGERAHNLHLMLLIDLSDRISPKVNPNASMPYYERDLEYIKSAVDAFSTHVRKRKIITINEKIELYIEPTPERSDINTQLSELKFHFTKDNVSKEGLVKMGALYDEHCREIYSKAINNKRFAGSDVWGFFKNKVKDHIDSMARNVLVILTDGYIYHDKNTFQRDGKYSYLTPQLTQSLALRSDNWEKIYKDRSYGLIPATTGLENLEVLILGINGSARSAFEDDVITRFLSDWLLSMGVARFEIKTTDLPVNVDSAIRNFILQ